MIVLKISNAGNPHTHTNNVNNSNNDAKLGCNNDTITSIKKINMIIYFNILTIGLDYILIIFSTCMSIFIPIECCLLFYP